MFLKNNKYFNNKNKNWKNNNWNNKKNNKFNYLRKNNIFIKHYKFLNDNENITNLYIKEYNSLKRKLNSKNILTLNYKYITKKIIYIFKNPIKEGLLKILNWREKLINFNFFYGKNLMDKNVYEFWNMNPCYLKYVYSKINRKHELKDVYNLSYRSIVVFPYTIKVKPYTIIMKNLFIKKCLTIFEWYNKTEKHLIIAKIINKSNKILKFKLIKSIKYNYNYIYNRLTNSKIYRNKIIKDFRISSKYVALNKIKFLFWVYENWLWRYRNNWVFVKSRREFSLNYQYFLLKIFKTRILNKFSYFQLPSDIFIERFSNFLYKKIFYFKNNYILKTNNLYKTKTISYKASRNMIFKFKDIYSNKISLRTYRFYTNMYYLYYYWFILLLQKTYQYINKIMFNLYLNFLHILNYNSINLNYSFILFNNNINNLKKINIINIDSKMLLAYRKLYINNIYINKLYVFNMDITRKEVLFCLNKITSKNIFSYFKNLQYIYTGKLFNIMKNNKITLLLDYLEDNSYLINVSFRKYYIETYRSLDYKLNGRINQVNKFIYNQEYINLNKHNLTNKDFININVNNVYLDNINWFKINYNIDNLGYSLNIGDLCYKNYEINIYEDKRFYYI